MAAATVIMHSFADLVFQRRERPQSSLILRLFHGPKLGLKLKLSDEP
jgi:hypothetical protein